MIERAWREQVRFDDYLEPVGLVIRGWPGSDARTHVLAPTYLPLEGPSTTLYGPNGAGKSLVLEALKACLSGLAPGRTGGLQIDLLTRLSDQDMQMGYSSLVTSIFVPGVLDEWGHFEETVRRDLEAISSVDPGIASEIAESGTFLLRPLGVAAPEWVLTPTVMPGPKAPIAARLLEDTQDWEDLGIENFWDGHPPQGAPPLLTTWTTFHSGGSLSGARRQHPSQLFECPVTDDDSDVDQMTRDALGRLGYEDFLHLLRFVGAPSGEGVDASLEPGTISGREALEADVNRLYSSLLKDSPVLEFVVKPLTSWFAEEAAGWHGRRGPDGPAVPLRDLSSGERRWAEIAIKIALASDSGSCLIMDEPEAALHRSAEAQMARGLGEVARSGLVKVVVSTHSPELLDERGSRRVWVRGRSGDEPGGLQPFEGADLESMANLGLLPSDLLRRERAYVLVEGEHDLLVLNGGFGDSLRGAGIRVIPIRGASRLKGAVDSQLLFDYTDATNIPFLDDIDVDALTSAWSDASTAVKTRPTSQVIAEVLLPALTRLGKSGDFLNPFLTGALKRSVESRVVPLGIRGRDILEYLPVEALVPGASSWEALRGDLNRDSGRADHTETEFKQWLQAKHKADLSDERIGEVARTSTPDPELAQLVARIREIASS